MKNETILIISAVLGAPFLGILVTSIFNKKRLGAETHNINIGGEISLSDGWHKYAMQQQKDKEFIENRLASFEAKITELQNKYDAIKIEKDTIAEASLRKDEKIKELELRVEELEKIIKDNGHLI